MSSSKKTVSRARTRLIITYLSIIMVLSLGFSAVFYQQSVQEANSNLQRQAVQLKDYLYFATPDDIQVIQEKQLDLFKGSLVKRLLLLNLAMLGLGSYFSLILAKRSLWPLEQALESQSRFTSDAAHELRTPLTAMKTEIEVSLRDKNLKTKDAKEVLESNLEEIGKLDALTAALLRLAKDTQKADQSYWQDYKLQDVLESAKARLDEEASRHKVKIILPKTKLTIYGDPDQLIELFVTLFSNGIKYSRKGGEVRVAAGQKESKIKVDVTDTGVGITEIDLPHIFDRFYRADQSRTKTEAGGYGLGLSLAKVIAESHGGKITVKSKYGQGSTFAVILPADQ